MAKIEPKIEKIRGGSRVSWADVRPDDECLPVSPGTFLDTAVSVEGVFDGGSCSIKGTNDPGQRNWILLEGGELLFLGWEYLIFHKEERPRYILQNPIFVKPEVSGSDNTRLNIILLIQEVG